VLVISFDIAALNVRKIIDRSTNVSARRGWLSFVMRSSSSSLKAPTLGIVRFVFYHIRFGRLIDKNQLSSHAAAN
jgi:hypothetical protein